jgi:hypothetical protein
MLRTRGSEPEVRPVWSLVRADDVRNTVLHARKGPKAIDSFFSLFYEWL